MDDSFVKAALKKVNTLVSEIPDDDVKTSGMVFIRTSRTRYIKDAIYAVDALKAALKMLK